MTPRRAMLAAGLFAAACREPFDPEVVGAVRAYDTAVVEAFRAGDVGRAQAVAGPDELRRLGALIGVKLDEGVTLDAALVELTPIGVERRPGEVVVTTRERWAYRDRRIGTGEQVAEASEDAYVMRYRLRRSGKRWIVDATEFAEPPKVGRTQLPPADASAMHGIDTRPPDGTAPGATP